MTYAAFTHKRVIDVLLMRGSTLPATPTAPAGVDTVGGVYAGGVRQMVVDAAVQACNEPEGTYEYDKIRPYPPNLYGPPIPVRTDCSGYAILCYKEGGAPDPNGLGYSGQGYTGTLILRGKWTGKPQPGDLAFWQSPDHVAVYGGNGIIYEFGGGTSPIQSTIADEAPYHQKFLGYKTYL